MKYENKANKILEDLANRNDNWDKLDGVIDQVTELEESRLILKNEIVNGSFENGTENWRRMGQSGSEVIETDSVHGSKSYKVVNAGRTMQSIDVPENHIIYGRCKVKTLKSSTGASQILRLRYGGNFVTISNIVGDWETYSIIDIGCTSFQIGTYTTENGECLLDNVVVMDLTETFGQGNEPTKEEMDVIMGEIGYFNGTHTITSKEQFNILLKMVRENALATTSLGGGF